MSPTQAEQQAPAERLIAPAEIEAASERARSRRTYRGKDLGEILPRIRAELGADAVVTHQREGLVGGIGGFFAQRFVEVEAMPAPEFGVDIYDGEDAEPPTFDYDEAQAAAAEQPMKQPMALDLSLGEPDRAFAVQLAAATDPADGGLSSELDWAPRYEDEPEPVAPAPDPQVRVRDMRQPAPAARAPQPAPLAPVAPPQPYELPPLPAAAQVPPQANPAPEPSAVDPPREPASWRDNAPTIAPTPVLLHTVDPGEGAIESAWFAGEGHDAAEFLIGRGMSLRLAEDLIGEARTHDLPFAGVGGMREALQSCIARRLPRHRGLPRGGALVALVGGGGSGKTRCAAAIAASYGSASTLDARAVVLGRYDSGAELSGLVEPHGVAVQTAERGSRTAGAIALSRAGELDVADTPTVSPADPAGIGILGVELAALSPEEVLVTLPATNNTISARQMLEALAPLHPTGIIVTHADETDQLGAAVELSLESQLPLVFIHQGLELAGALMPADPGSIAERLLA